MEETQQELTQKFQMFEQQIQHLSNQIQAVEEGVTEMNYVNTSLDDLKGKEGKEILAPFGRGIFVKAKLLSEELIVDVGNRNFVNKSVDDTKKTINEQIVKLNEVHAELTKSLSDVDKALTEAMVEARKKADSIKA